MFLDFKLFPFSSTTIFFFSDQQLVDGWELRIFDRIGRLVRSYPINKGNAKMSKIWDGQNSTGKQCPSGLYLALVSGKGFQKSVRLLLLR